MSQKIRALALLGILVIGVFLYLKFKPVLLTTLPRIEEQAAGTVIKEIQKQISAPQPLKVSKIETPGATLSIEGVIASTNRERVKIGLPPLKENDLLDASAKLKTNDMFANQYFAHESPAGKGPADLAVEVGYNYILIGENLALGNFSDDEDLVTAWMNSPGHRANILHPRYTEIGVSVKRSVYEGRITWIATQEFGLSTSACPITDPVLAAQIDGDKAELNSMSATLATDKAELDSMNSHDPAYNEKVNEYNNLVGQYNALIAVTKELIARYNAQVTAVNNCIQGT